MITFAPGGGVIEIESNGPGTALGSWKVVSHDHFAFTIQNFGFDPTGQLIGTARVRAVNRLHPDGNTFDGPFRFEAFDPNGNLVASGGGTAVARRFPVLPL